MKPIMKLPFSIILLIPPILIAIIALLMIFIPLPAPLPRAASHARNLPAAIITGILGLAWVILLMSYVINSFLTAGHVLDSTFSGMGFKGSPYLIVGREYLGMIEGREIKVQFLPGQVLQNPLLEIRIETKLNQDMAIGLTRPLLGCSDCGKVEVAAHALDNIQIYAKDSTWAQLILKDLKITSLITRLMDETNGAGFREVYIQPATIWLRARPSVKFEEKNVQDYLDLLLKLAEAIERSN